MEPNNRFGSEICGACNFTEAYSGTWGWSDTQCSRNLSFICEVDREWLLGAALPACSCCVRMYQHPGATHLASQAPAGSSSALLCPAAPGFFHYYSNNTNSSYILSTYTNYSHSAAEAYCQKQGGHLAVWASMEEQAEVEQYYITQVRCCQFGLVEALCCIKHAICSHGC